MDPTLIRIAIRTIAAYLYLLALLRVSGRQTIRHGTPFDFVLALILGDLVDNVLFGDASFAQFVSATATLASARLLLAPRMASEDMT